MRVLIQSELYPPIVSGESVFTRSLARGLARRGHSVQVFTARAPGSPAEHQDGAVHVFRTRAIRNPAYDTFRIGVWPFGDAARIFETFGPRVVQLNNPGPSAWALLRLARRRGIRVVATNHFIPSTTWQNRPVLAPMAPSVERVLSAWIVHLYNQVDLVTAPSRYALDVLRRRGLNAPARVVSNGVDLARFHPARRAAQVFGRWSIPPDARVVLHLGRIYPSKRVEVLLQGFRRAPPDTWLLVCGDGPDRPRLERLAPPRVVFAGQVEDALLPALYASADLFVIASTAELQGIVVLESLASGVPVLAAGAGALPELVRPGRTGELFRPGDPHDFAVRLNHLLRASVDLSRTARLAAEGHDHEQTLSQFEQLLTT